MKQRPHAEVIKAWADGAQVQYRQHITHPWKDCNDPAFVEDYEYRVKPAEPERNYPPLLLCNHTLDSEFRRLQREDEPVLRAFANFVIKTLVDAGQVVTREEFDRAVGDRADRDWRIADKVAAEMATLLHPSVALRFYNLDLKAIIAKVKA